MKSANFYFSGKSNYNLVAVMSIKRLRYDIMTLKLSWMSKFEGGFFRIILAPFWLGETDFFQLGLLL